MTPFTIVHKETGLTLEYYADQHCHQIPAIRGVCDIKGYFGVVHLIHENGHPAFAYDNPYTGGSYDLVELDPSIWEVRFDEPSVSQIMEATTPENSEP